MCSPSKLIHMTFCYYAPLQLLKLFAIEADYVASLISQLEITNEKVEVYLKHLKTLSANYKKVLSSNPDLS